jgi:7-cyano-7-deazaguanine synthase
VSQTNREARAPHAAVLLSGGLDSTAALLWAARAYPEVRAIAFDYGQPHRDAELACAQVLCDSLGVSWNRFAISDTMPRGGLLTGVRDHDPTGQSINPAFVPGRNAVFLTVAAAHAASWWKGNIDMVIGACAEDAMGFPDCKASWLGAMGTVLRQGMAREIRVVAPFVDRTKEQILRSFPADTVPGALLATSWSCYRGLASGPCATCSACVKRAAAFAAVGATDYSAHPVMCGGDAHRERA